MAQDKKVFTGGMDKDSDPRLIKQGDYRDALNIRTVSSSDSTAGSVENIEGNTLVPYNFITESNQYVNVESGIGVNGTSISIENVEPELINLSQTIFFLGAESINYQSSFTLGYETSEYLEQGKIGPFVHSISTNPLNEFKNLKILSFGLNA